MSSLTFALVQCATHWHDAAANRAAFDGWFTRLPPEADVVVLPEMFSTGFTMSAAEVAEPMEGPTVRWLGESAARLGKVVCGSLVIEDAGRRFNRFVWLEPDGTIAAYDKRHLFRMAGEHLHYVGGDERRVIAHHGVRILPIVCYDLRFPVWTRNRGDYDVVLCVANWPAARQVAWNALLKARAVENSSYAVGVNRVGVDGNDVRYRGGTAVYDPSGDTRLEVFDAEGVFTVTLDGAALETHRETFPAWRDADGFELTMK